MCLAVPSWNITNEPYPSFCSSRSQASNIVKFIPSQGPFPHRRNSHVLNEISTYNTYSLVNSENIWRAKRQKYYTSKRKTFIDVSSQQTEKGEKDTTKRAISSSYVENCHRPKERKRFNTMFLRRPIKFRNIWRYIFARCLAELRNL